MFDPAEGALHCLSPSDVGFFPLVVAPERFPLAIGLPVTPERTEVRPEPDCEARGIRNSERRRLCDDWTDNRDTQNVSLMLHE